MAQSPEDQTFTRPAPIHRPEGVNASERYLAKLCDRSFLSLWSYSSLTRDQGRKNGRGAGKELCDLLVVFGNDILIFEDKECTFNNSGNLELDWSRWYRNAIEGGAKPIWVAERWIKEHPDKIFMDRACTQPFPLALPDSSVAKYHRVIVAHGASERCKQEIGGSGSLRIMATGADDGGVPFAIGQTDLSRGFIHVFDDITIDIVLQTLDTVRDFVTYLVKKEAFITSGQFHSAAGEEELLAMYLAAMNVDGQHDFVVPKGYGSVLFGRGAWDKSCQHPQRVNQLKANKVSDFWDWLIDEFGDCNLAGTQGYVTHPIHETEIAIRFLAGENRTSRRALSEAFLSVITTPSSRPVTHIVSSPTQPGVYYILMALPRHGNYSEEDYTAACRRRLRCFSMVTKLKCPNAEHIVGIATEAGLPENESYAFVYHDARDWSEEDRMAAEKIQKEFDILNNVRTFEGMVQEYPDVYSTSYRHREEAATSASTKIKRVGRNDPCPCGSGNKFKRCHGKYKGEHE